MTDLRHPSQGSLCSRCCNDDHQPLGVPCVLLELLKSRDGWIHEAPKWGWCGHDGLRPWQGCFWALSEEMESYRRLRTRGCTCGMICRWNVCARSSVVSLRCEWCTMIVLWHVLVSGDVVWSWFISMKNVVALAVLAVVNDTDMASCSQRWL